MEEGTSANSSEAKDESTLCSNQPLHRVIISPHIIQHLPFGEGTIILSTRETIKVPNVTRMILSERIVIQYMTTTKPHYPSAHFEQVRCVRSDIG